MNSRYIKLRIIQIRIPNMKCQVVCLVVVVFVALVSADESPVERSRRFHRECQTDPTTSVDEAVFKNAIKGEVDVAAVGPHIFCMNVKLGMQKPNGDIDKEELREAIKTARGYDETKADTIVEECGTRKGDSANEAAVALFECYLKHTKREHEDH